VELEAKAYRALAQATFDKQMLSVMMICSVMQSYCCNDVDLTGGKFDGLLAFRL
jgi:hypothetical protein